jgi:hypothetical protein
MPSTMMQQKRKLRSFNNRRFTTGFFVCNSQKMAETIQTTATIADHVMKVEPNQSSSCPRSRTISRVANPSETKANPATSTCSGLPRCASRCAVKCGGS